jgi:hypothetical protein
VSEGRKVWLALLWAEIPTRLQHSCVNDGMTVGPSRFRIPRVGSPGPGSSNEGLVVQAVLLMALVTTIGIFVIAARVAGSRQSAASSSLSLAARQAAEFGYAETMAEINRDPRSYLWVTKFSEWNNVTAQDLRDCGVASSADPVADPISGSGSNQTLPNSPELSYRLTDYRVPANLTSPPASAPAVCSNKFGNLIGGTGEITIVGTVDRGGGDTSTFTLKRTVSVKRAAPIFNNPITAIPPNRSFDAADNRFPVYPDAADSTRVAYPGTPSGTYGEIICEPNGSSPTVINCTSGSLSANFKSATATGAGNDYFPYSGGAPWGPCQQVGVPPNEVVRCLVTSMTVRNNANMLIKTTARPVEIFLSNDMTITSGSRLSGDDWLRFRIFGVTSGASCGSQTITINPYSNTATTPTTVETNLQNAFLWFSKGKLKYETSTVLASIPALVGSVCQFESAVAAPANLSTLSNRSFLEGLGGAYGFKGLGGADGFDGLFGGTAPIRFFYRGFGFYEQAIS